MEILRIYERSEETQTEEFDIDGSLNYDPTTAKNPYLWLLLVLFSLFFCSQFSRCLLSTTFHHHMSDHALMCLMCTANRQRSARIYLQGLLTVDKHKILEGTSTTRLRNIYFLLKSVFSCALVRNSYGSRYSAQIDMVQRFSAQQALGSARGLTHDLVVSSHQLTFVAVFVSLYGTRVSSPSNVPILCLFSPCPYGSPLMFSYYFHLLSHPPERSSVPAQCFSVERILLGLRKNSWYMHVHMQDASICEGVRCKDGRDMYAEAMQPLTMYVEVASIV